MPALPPCSPDPRGEPGAFMLPSPLLMASVAHRLLREARKGQLKTEKKTLKGMISCGRKGKSPLSSSQREAAG